MRRYFSAGLSIMLILLLYILISSYYKEILVFLLLSFSLLILCLIFFNYLEKKKYLESGINDIDNMTGEQFEIYLKYYFQKLGYKVELTSRRSDYGADLILKKDDEVIVIQAKRYSKAVGIRAVQEIIGAMSYYRASKGIVVTNNYFTSNAVNLAQKSSIELWDRNIIIDKFRGIQNLSDK